MDFDYSPKTKDLQARLLQFMDEHVYPNEAAYKNELVPTRPRASAGRPCPPSRTSNPRPRPPACGICSCRWTVPPHRAIQAPA